MSEAMSGKTLVRLIVPVTEKLIVSESLLLPAAHSPGIRPDAMFVLAAVIASRKVHNPSALFATSDVVLTTIVTAAGAITSLWVGAKYVESALVALALVGWTKYGRAGVNTNAAATAENKTTDSAAIGAREMEDNNMRCSLGIGARNLSNREF